MCVPLCYRDFYELVMIQQPDNEMQVQALTMKTKVTISRPGSPSLRVTIPEGYAQLLRLKAGDELQ